MASRLALVLALLNGLGLALHYDHAVVFVIHHSFSYGYEEPLVDTIHGVYVLLVVNHHGLD